MTGAIQSTKQENLQDPSKFYYHFLYKAVVVAILLVILPLFPSQAPEFINQSLLTRNWELLHLLFVGIAISYGLFSRRNDETEKEINSSRFDNAHLVVSRFLQVSSFFEDEDECPSESDEIHVQTWSNQYHRNKPVFVVVQQHSNFDEKPLLLPVRSFVYDPGVVQSTNVSSASSASLSTSSSTSKSCSKRFSSNSNKARNGELEGSGSPKVEDKMKDNVVLPSPIPWRSEFSMLESHSMNDSRPNSSISSSSKLTPFSSLSSPEELSPSPSFSSESLAKNAEDLMKKKDFYNSSPPPPPPPLPLFLKSVSMKPRSSSFNQGASFDKELKRSFGTSERNDLTWSSGDELMGRVDSEIQVKPKGHMSFRTDKLMGHASVPLVSEPTSMEFSEEEKESFLDKVVVESDEDTETEDEEVGGRFIQKYSGESPPHGESSKTDRPSSSSNGDEGPDVDKKADEFIAKFREQIRLQRIESIKRSAWRITTSNSSRGRYDLAMYLTIWKKLIGNYSLLIAIYLWCIHQSVNQSQDS